MRNLNCSIIDAANFFPYHILKLGGISWCCVIPALPVLDLRRYSFSFSVVLTFRSIRVRRNSIGFCVARGCGVAEIVVRRLALRHACTGSIPGSAPLLEIPLLSSSSEDIGVGLNDYDLYVMKCMSQSIKIQ
jgi:hypothetical protein